MVRNRVKISVVKRVEPEYIFGGKVPHRPGTLEPFRTCSEYSEGDTWVVETDNVIPEGFCPQAWYDILRKLNIIHWGGSFADAPGGDSVYACCSDGSRPVIFKIERVID